MACETLMEVYFIGAASGLLILVAGFALAAIAMLWRSIN